jgi:5-methylcytosine-specific restriction endonuclease McrA
MYFLILLIIVGAVLKLTFDHWLFNEKRKGRRDYYRNQYLASEAWKRKRYVVFKRDGWRCVYCGAPATQVHHKRYAKKRIGREPIKWLVSVCKSCHDHIHR